MVFVFFFLSLFTSLSLSDEAGQNQQSNFTNLVSDKVRGRDYEILVADRDHPITIFAIHGGRIEPGTCKLALDLSQGIFNSYLFRGLIPGDTWGALHLTSSRYDEEKALELAEKSSICVSIHSYPSNTPELCLGGGNQGLSQKLASLLSQNPDFRVHAPCEKFPGTNSNNIVNRCQGKGIQIEISSGLMRHLDSDSTARQMFLSQIRDGISY